MQDDHAICSSESVNNITNQIIQTNGTVPCVKPEINSQLPLTLLQLPPPSHFPLMIHILRFSSIYQDFGQINDMGNSA
jgi:hypothetical protein